MSIEWTKDLATDVNEIDDQHKELLKNMNELLIACRHGKGREVIDKLMLFLSDYVVHHFGTEERFMDSYNYESSQSHKSQHEYFKKKFSDIRRRLEINGGRLTAVVEITQLLGDWLINHIGKVDKALGEFLKTKTLLKGKRNSTQKTIGESTLVGELYFLDGMVTLNMDYSDYKNLKKYCYFSCLSESTLKALAQSLHTVKFQAGTEVIREGTSADAFYLVFQGELEILKKTRSGQTIKLSVIGHGEGFGEMALLTSVPRWRSVTAKTDVKLLKLYKTDFEEIVRMDPAFSHATEKLLQSYSSYNQIKALKPFANLKPEKMITLLDKLREITYPPGKNIFVQGEKGDVYYIIESGNVAVFKKMLKDEFEHVATLHAGEGFGEEALIDGEPHSATIQTIDETTLWTLSKADFAQIMKSSFFEEISPEEVLAINKESCIFLDVRTQMEFDEERLPEAINIPLDELRKRYSELNYSKEYYVYCLVGARSASATFFLNSHGFRAKNIKGGIINWTGSVEEGKQADGGQLSSTPT